MLRDFLAIHVSMSDKSADRINSMTMPILNHIIMP
jgi:hypothetical protein